MPFPGERQALAVRFTHLNQAEFKLDRKIDVIPRHFDPQNATAARPVERGEKACVRSYQSICNPLLGNAVRHFHGKFSGPLPQEQPTNTGQHNPHRISNGGVVAGIDRPIRHAALPLRT